MSEAGVGGPVPEGSRAETAGCGATGEAAGQASRRSASGPAGAAGHGALGTPGGPAVTGPGGRSVPTPEAPALGAEPVGGKESDGPGIGPPVLPPEQLPAIDHRPRGLDATPSGHADCRGTAAAPVPRGRAPDGEGDTRGPAAPRRPDGGAPAGEAADPGLSAPATAAPAEPAGSRAPVAASAPQAAARVPGGRWSAGSTPATPAAAVGIGEAASVRAARGPEVLAVAMFLGSFAWSFVFVSLPFHIQRISTADPGTTLRWTGWILGITSLVTVVTSPLWGRLAARGRPKRYYVAVEALQGVGFLGMAAARTLPELFLARLVLGLTGASSTIAFIVAGRGPDAGEVRRRVALVQAAMTVGQVLGPLAGAVTAARVGFRASFVVGGLILLGGAALVQWGVPVLGEGGEPRRVGRRIRVQDLGIAATIVLVGSTHLFFLAAVLPRVLPALGVPPEGTVEAAGIVIFASAAAAALGAFAAPRLGELVPERRLIPALLAASSVSLVALGPTSGVWSYTAVRFLQVLLVAPVFPLVVARMAEQGGGGAIGIVNAARIGAAFVGPVAATSILSWTSPGALYGVLGLAGLGSAALARLPGPAARARRGLGALPGPGERR